MRKYKAIIYDCDGTLLDSKIKTVRAYEILLGRKLKDFEKELVFHQTEKETFERYGLEYNKKNRSVIQDLYMKSQEFVKPFDGIMYLLKEVHKRKVHQGLATNRNKRGAIAALNSNNLYKYLSDVAHAELVENPKPAGDMLLYYVKKHKLNLKETLFVGNALTDHGAALDAGMDFAYVSWGTEEYREEEAIILNRPSDLLLYIEEDIYDKNLCPQGI